MLDRPLSPVNDVTPRFASLPAAATVTVVAGAVAGALVLLGRPKFPCSFTFFCLKLTLSTFFPIRNPLSPCTAAAAPM